jgi:RHS repeat-associated protein
LGVRYPTDVSRHKVAKAVVNTYTYDAYGQPLTTSVTVANPSRYTGEYLDEESGFIYLRARYYDLESQQFLTLTRHLPGLRRSMLTYVALTQFSGVENLVWRISRAGSLQVNIGGQHVNVAGEGS